MSRDDVYDMAKEAGFDWHSGFAGDGELNRFEVFAALVRAEVMREMADSGHSTARAGEASTTPAPAWQPMETAPKDGTRILVMCHHGDIEVSEWYEHWYDRYEEAGNGLYRKVREKSADGWNSNLPTHWMPLPAAPKEAA